MLASSRNRVTKWLLVLGFRVSSLFGQYTVVVVLQCITVCDTFPWETWVEIIDCTLLWCARIDQYSTGLELIHTGGSCLRMTMADVIGIDAALDPSSH
jgi:hypothetical protein